MMTEAQRTIGLGAFVLLVGLGTGWALGTTRNNPHPQGGAAVRESVKASEAVTVSPDRKPLNAQPTDSSPEYDRSDLILSQG